MRPSEKKSTTESIELYKQSLEGNNYSPQSIKAYMGDLGQFVEWLKTRRVDWDIPYRIQRIDIVEFINHLANRKTTAVTRKRKLAAIRGFLKFLKDNQIILGNPADTIEGPIREERDPAILLKTEYKALLQVAGGNARDFAIVMLFLQSGLRVSELVNLKIQDVDFTIAHLFGFYNPKQLADFLHVPHQKFYAELKDWSVYHVKKMLLRFMVKQAAEQLKPVLSKSAATRSRAGMTLSIDNSVMDRFGKLLRCTWNWYSGRYHKVIRGQDLLGIVLTINHIAFPLHLLFCPKQGRYHTNKADLLIFMLTQLKDDFDREGIDITQLPLTMDSAFVSQALRQRLHQ